MILSPDDERELLNELDVLTNTFDDDEAFAAESLRIMLKSGIVAPFIWNNAQRKFHRAVERQKKQGKPVRIVVLKARQVGFSTSVAGEFWKQTAFIPGQKTLIVAQEKAPALNLFNYYLRFHENYVPYKNLLYLPKLKSKTNQCLKYVNDSELRVTTANNLKAARSFTIRRLHLSEYAFYRDAHTFMAGVLQCVPDDSDTMIVIESTANGLGGPYYMKWQEAWDDKIESDWEPVFYGWQEEPGYRIPMRDEEKYRFQKSLTDEEFELKHKYRLDLEQLAWRRWTIRNKCERDERTFKQEYPSCPEEAFLVTGRPRYSPLFFQWMPTMKPAIGGLSRFQVATKEILQFIPRERGEFHLWKKPEPGREYIIGIDSSLGIDINQGKGTPDPDYSVAQVIERSVGEQVAMLRERMEPISFATYLYDVGRWYNWAYLVPEINSGGDGIGVVRELIRLGYPLDRIYTRETIEERSQRTTNKIGFLTTPATKPQLLAQLESLLVHRALILHCPITVAECYSFVIKPNSRAEAADGCHDDTVIALALAALGMIVAPQLNIKKLTSAVPAQVRQYGATHRERIKQIEHDGHNLNADITKLRILRRSD